jgi:ATP-dependent DNA ligase
VGARGGYDWSKRYPWIVESALKNRYKQFVIDGEAVLFGVDGISDCNALAAASRERDLCEVTQAGSELFFSFPNVEAFLPLFIDDDHLRWIFHVFD